jgi:hypothetical protein
MATGSERWTFLHLRNTIRASQQTVSSDWTNRAHETLFTVRTAGTLGRKKAIHKQVFSVLFCGIGFLLTPVSIDSR